MFQVSVLTASFGALFKLMHCAASCHDFAPVTSTFRSLYPLNSTGTSRGCSNLPPPQSVHISQKQFNHYCFQKSMQARYYSRLGKEFFLKRSKIQVYTRQLLKSKMQISHGYIGVLKTSQCYIQRTKRSIKTIVILKSSMNENE